MMAGGKFSSSSQDSPINLVDLDRSMDVGASSKYRQFSLPDESLTNQKLHNDSDCDIQFKCRTDVSINTGNQNPQSFPLESPYGTRSQKSKTIISDTLTTTKALNQETAVSAGERGEYE